MENSGIVPTILADMDNGNTIISNRTVLTILTFTTSTIGIALSTIALVLLIVTAILFAEWRRNYKNQLLIQFMLARFFFTIARYYYDVTKVFDINVIPKLFTNVDMFILIYTEMLLLAWIAVFTKQMYDSLAKLFIFETPRLWKVSLVTWITPCFCATVFVVIYVLRFQQLRLYLVYLLILKLPIIVFIAILLVKTTKSIIDVNKSKTENNPRIVMVMVCLIYVFCIQQIAVDIYKLVAVIIMNRKNEMPDILHTFFVILNIGAIYHCAFSIMFWLFGNAQTRKLWKFGKNHESPQKCLPLRLSTK